MENELIPTQKYKIGTYFKSKLDSKSRVVIVNVRLNVFMDTKCWLYEIKDIRHHNRHFTNTFTEYQLEGIYELDPTAQVLLGDK